MRYLQYTNDIILTFSRVDDLDILGYVKMKSKLGDVVKMAGDAILWKSVKQTITASSTLQVEFAACYKTTIQAI